MKQIEQKTAPLSSYRMDLGRKGERLVADTLVAQGFTLCAVNFRARCGEIDLIARKDELLVFVEVKLRQTHYFNLSQVVTRAKQLKIIKTAHYFMATHRYALSDFACRFDVACVEPDEMGVFGVTYLPNAFQESIW